MLRLSACTADCVLGCGLIETAHIHNSSSISTSSLPQPPFCITCRRSRMCPQRTTAAISCCNLGQDTSTLCTVGFQKVVSARCFWYVPLSLCTLGQRLSCAASKFIFTSRKYLVYTHIHTHTAGAEEAATRPKSFPLALAALGFPLVARVIISGQSH